MTAINDYNIGLSGLKDGNHTFDYQIDVSFFDLFDYHEFEDCDLQTTLLLNKQPSMIDCHFIIKGKLSVRCDISNEFFDMPINTDWELVIKFGENYNDDDDQLLIVPPSTHQINIAQYIYETTALSIPMQKRHPKLDDTSKNHLLYKTPTNSKILDPRWQQLQTLSKLLKTP